MLFLHLVISFFLSFLPPFYETVRSLFDLIFQGINHVQSNLPSCPTCNAFLPVRHILLDCPRYVDTHAIAIHKLAHLCRRPCLRDTLEESPQLSIESIILFLRQVNLLNQIHVIALRLLFSDLVLYFLSPCRIPNPDSFSY